MAAFHQSPRHKAPQRDAGKGDEGATTQALRIAAAGKPFHVAPRRTQGAVEAVAAQAQGWTAYADCPTWGGWPVSKWCRYGYWLNGYLIFTRVL